MRDQDGRCLKMLYLYMQFLLVASYDYSIIFYDMKVSLEKDILNKDV